MKKKLLAMIASAALTLVIGSVAFADEPTTQTDSTPQTDAATNNAPVITKQVKDVNGAEAIESDWQDAADCDIQATVPFRLSAQLPENFDEFETYELVFHDTMAKSLTFDETSLKVYYEAADGSQATIYGVDATNPVEGIALATTGIPKGETFNVIIPNAKAIPNVVANTTIYVEYYATLNDKAVTGSMETGNPNRMYITYPEAPGSENIATSDKVMATLFTYKVTIECQNDQGKPLAGSQFKIYRKNGGDYKEVEAGQFVVDAHGSIFTAKGLDEGQYKISEVATPTGCTPIADIYFTIVGTYETGNHGVQLTRYEYILTDLEGNPIDETGEATFFVDKDKGSLSRTVVHTDAQVSTSSGPGNFIVFIIAGAIVVLGALATIVVIRKTASK